MTVVFSRDILDSSMISNQGIKMRCTGKNKSLPFASGLSLFIAACFLAPVLPYSHALAQGNDPFAPPPGAEEQEDLLPPGPGTAFGEDESFDFEKSSQTIEEEIRQEAFDSALQGLLPLRPEEIRKLLERFDTTQEAVQTPVYPNPKPEFTVKTIPLDPGTAPISVNVAYGHVTTINVLDSTGSPWPIEDVTWAGNFEVIDSTSNPISNIIRISPQSEFAYGNMSMKLVKLQTPIVLTLDTSRDTVHYRFDAVIPDVGPMGKEPLIDPGITITAGDPDMTSILEGVVPPGAERLDVSGVDSRTSAYSYNGMTVLRTPLTLLSPGWNASVSSADGTHVYSFRETPVVLLSERGKMVRARISSRGDLFDE